MRYLSTTLWLLSVDTIVIKQAQHILNLTQQYASEKVIKKLYEHDIDRDINNFIVSGMI